MPEEALQAAFEIKTACDEISRRLLRWHWEHKPGAHSLGALLDHVAQRQQESPDYYDRMPDLSGKNSWQQLDTTICMRVLLDPEKDAAKPLDLLGNTSNPGAARRACNAVRTARNEAAHATDHTDAAQAAILFNEAVESLEDGYVGTAFRENELARYYRDAENYLARCGAKEPIASSRAPEEKTAAARSQPARAQSRARTAAPRAAKRPAAVPPAAEAPQRAAARPKAAARQAAKRNREELAIKPCSSFCWWSCCWGLPCVHGAWAQPDRLQCPASQKKAVFCTQLPEKQKCVRNKPGKAHLAGWVKAVYNKHENVYT
ncbi:MAG: hypothetical protein ACLS4Y_04090 [Faecalibacterium sp.]